MGADSVIRWRRESQDPAGSVDVANPVLPVPASPAAPRKVEAPHDRGADRPATAGEALRLVEDLCRALDEEHVRYCHWKSNESIARSASGENDLDLLVSRPDALRFEGILRRLGFRDAEWPRWKRLPGVYHSYGLDRRSGRLVHIHAHYQLVVGDDMTKNFRLPIEAPYLASSARAIPFPIPAPAFELAVFLLRMTIKHSTWDAVLSFQGSLSASERRELDDLLAHVHLPDVWALAERHLPFVSRALLERCLRSARPGSSTWFRIRTANELQGALVGWSRRPLPLDTSLRIWRRFRTVVRRKVLRRGPVPGRFVAGGALIGFVGGDGAGKSTAVDGLSHWLGEEHIFPAVVHMGKPRWSILTWVVKGPLKMVASVKRGPTSSAVELRSSLAAPDGPLSLRSRVRLVWEVMTARDRYRTYRRARRLASNGAIVLCDRYPLAEVQRMDGPVTARMTQPAQRGRWATSLARLEQRYYARITDPDILIVLRVDPDVAVQRRMGVDPESTVRPRSEEIWRLDWEPGPAIVIDASGTEDDVLSEIKSAVWSRL